MSTGETKRMHPRNQEFIAMAKLCRWSQAEVARQLRLTPGAVSQIYHGKTRPHRRTLQLLKLLLAKRNDASGKRFENALEVEARERQVLEWMRRLPQAQSHRFLESLRLLMKAFSSGRQNAG
jgi:transcriptional regulator with XRE-family HTH domain